MTFDYTAPHNGTPVPGTNPDGYMLGPDQGSMTWFVGALLTFKAKAADTRGTLSFFQVECLSGWQAPVHKHANESELFYITEGEFEIFVNDTVHLAGPGCTVWIPQNTAHSIFVRSQRGRGHCVITPAGFEKFFEDLGEPATTPSMPTHPTRMPSVEELLQGGEAMGWILIEPTPRRLDER
jgi:quercetin dioxygenase-like cupin family protein